MGGLVGLGVKLGVGIGIRLGVFASKREMVVAMDERVKGRPEDARCR